MIASIEEPKVIAQILKHLKQKADKYDISTSNRQNERLLWFHACSTHLSVVLLMNGLKAYTASFTVAVGATYIRRSSSQ
ncbi:hypothetical protein A5320_18070 [Rheinheimera sp. SA_1]|nr:hypothetical protein A5320_18070 [Rheinheimera sp. SA_1]